MQLLEIKTLLFDAYFTLLKTECPLERAKLMKDIKELAGLVETLDIDDSKEPWQVHKKFDELFGVLDEYFHTEDPLTRAKLKKIMDQLHQDIEEKMLAFKEINKGKDELVASITT